MFDKTADKPIMIDRDYKSKIQDVSSYIRMYSETRGNAIAVTDGIKSVSWEDLVYNVNSKSEILIKRGVNPGEIVIISMQRSIELYEWILAVWNIHAVYAPVDPSSPADRNEYIFASINPVLVISDASEINELMRHDSNPLYNDAAYIIFTSGSTGKPKGVINHRAGLHYALFMMRKLLPVTTSDTVLHFLSPGFDASLFEIGLHLSTGASLAIVPPHISAGKELATFINSTGVFVMASTPSIYSVLNSAELPGLKTVIMGGEVMTSGLAALWMQNSRLYNVYGPTEVALWSSIGEITDPDDIHIGSPLPGLSFALRNNENTHEGDETAGELYITGESVASGYIGTDALVKSPFSTFEHGNVIKKSYKTGDILKQRSDGKFQYCGRADRQVKIRGFRIEPGEIETVLMKAGLLKSCLVKATGSGSSAKLSAYIIPAAGILDTLAEEQYLTGMKSLSAFTYRTEKEMNATEFFGWKSKLTGKPFTEKTMHEWVNGSLARIRSCKGSNYLEIGCGSGIIGTQLLDEAEHYTGTDISSEALAIFKSRTLEKKITPDFLCCGANEIRSINKIFDTIIINSVVQYFPSLGYLQSVIEICLSKLEDRGVIYIGDIRNYDLLSEYASYINSHGSQKYDPESDNELIISPRYFRQLTNISGTQVSTVVMPRIGCHDNELGIFRYDAFIIKHDQKPLSMPATPVMSEIFDISKGIYNKRLLPFLKNVHDTFFNAHVADPDDFEHIHNHYLIPVLSSSSPYQFDIISCWQKSGVHIGDITIPAESSATNQFISPDFSNNPAEKTGKSELTEKISEYAKQHLPHYMVPAFYSILQCFPRTHHGKIDEKALPEHHQERTGYEGNSENEKKIIDVWTKILNEPPESPESSFTASGGTSLQIIELVSTIEEIFNCSLSLPAIISNSTIRFILQSIAGHAHNPDGQLMELTSGTTPVSFLPVFIHPLSGTVDCYKHLTDYLHDIRTIGISGGSRLPLSMEDLAASYIRLLIKERDGENFHLIGWSFGGMLAYEMACQLYTMGRKVELTIIDTAIPLKDDAFTEKRLKWICSEEGTDALSSYHHKLAEIYQSYTPKQLRATITLIEAENRSSWEQSDPLFTQGRSLGWEYFAQVQNVKSPGAHLTMLNSVNAAKASLTIRELILEI